MRRDRQKPFRAGALLLTLLATSLRAEDRRGIPSFAAGVELVSLSLAVTDGHGRPVGDLTRDELAVFEDGVPQEISVFAQEEWPIRLSILVDSSGSMAAVLPVARKAAIRLLRTLRAGDEAEVAQFKRTTSVLQDLTADREALEQAVGRISPSGDTALYNALYVALKDRARRSTEVSLARRAVVVLSDGEDTASMVDDEQLLDVARRAGVVVYTVGLLEPPRAGHPAKTLPTYVLTALARETGGRAFFPRTLAELEGAYERIAEELRTLYGVGYVPRNPRSSGQWRTIAVRARQGSLIVRHRSRYFAPEGGEGRRLGMMVDGHR
jgi:Ca-activated chloride channel family protein